jgi:hypothetical protein
MLGKIERAAKYLIGRAKRKIGEQIGETTTSSYLNIMRDRFTAIIKL